MALTEWRDLAPTCLGDPSKESCDDGDMTLFNGLLCAAGVNVGCDAVKRAQSSSGQWWRSPRRIDDRIWDKNQFSKDMAMGVLLYLVKTKDRSAAQRWWSWMADNRPCIIENPFNGGCIKHGEYRLCRRHENETCTINPGLYDLMGRAWRFIGMTPPDRMRQFTGVDENTEELLASTTPTGYQLHLRGVTILLNMLMNYKVPNQRRLAQILLRRQPENIFFRFLAEGRSTKFQNLFTQQCAISVPGGNYKKWQWAWERDTKEKAWSEKMFWDCIFIHRLKLDF